MEVEYRRRRIVGHIDKPANHGVDKAALLPAIRLPVTARERTLVSVPVVVVPQPASPRRRGPGGFTVRRPGNLRIELPAGRSLRSCPVRAARIVVLREQHVDAGATPQGGRTGVAPCGDVAGAPPIGEERPDQYPAAHIGCAGVRR